MKDKACINPVEVSFKLPKGTLRGLKWTVSSEAPIIIALHGWLDNVHSFLPLVSQLNLSHHQFIAIDLPGHGQSDHYADGYLYSLADYVLDVSQLIHQITDQKIILLGHSLGGAIATLCAAAQPDKIEKLILLDALGPMVTANKDTVMHFKKAVDQYCHQTHRPKTQYADLEMAIAARMKGIGNISARSSRLLVARGIKSSNSGFEWSSDPSLRKLTPIRFAESQVQRLLESIQCPTLLLAASKGYISTNSKVNPRINYIDNLKVEKIEGGHHFHMEGDIEKAATILNHFLS